MADESEPGDIPGGRGLEVGPPARGLDPLVTPSNPLNELDSSRSSGGGGGGRGRLRSRSRPISESQSGRDSGDDGWLETPIGSGRGGRMAVSLERGHRVGRYVISRAIGRGGMGVVYAAYDPELDRRVALKLVRIEGAAPADTDSRGKTRLLREAQSMASFTHPNVVEVHQAGVHENHVFIAMEFVEGASLRDWLNERSRNWREVVPVFVAAGRGLEAAHASGIVHRDFKPDNVLVSVSGTKVVDFGLARTVEDDMRRLEDDTAVRRVIQTSGVSAPRALDAHLTMTGAAVGTPAYMSPEQHAAMPAGASSDQFSFCVALYEALAGHRPYERRTVAELGRAKADGRVTPLDRRAAPDWLWKIVERGLAPKPGARWPDMRSLVGELEQGLARNAGRRAWLPLSLLATSLVAVLGYVAVSGSRGPCPPGDTALNGVWDSTRRSEVGDVFLNSGRPMARDTWNRFQRSVDAYAGTWAEAQHEICVATRVRREQDQEWFDRRMLCLDGRRKELDRLLERLQDSPPDRLASIATATERLTPPSACTRGAEVEEVPRPDDPELAEEVEELRHKLAGVADLRRNGQAPLVLERARDAAGEAKRLGYAPVQAEALRELAKVQVEVSDDVERQVKLLHQSAQTALLSGYDRAAVGAWIDLIGALTKLERYEQAQRWVAYVERKMASFSQEPGLEASLEGAQVWLAIHEERIADAQRHASRELELVERDFGASHPRSVTALNHVALALYYDHKKDEALEYLYRSLELAESLHGPESAQVSPALNNIAVILTDRGDYDEAVELYERSLSIRERMMAEGNPDLMQAYDNLAELLMRDKSYARALPYARRTVELAERSYGVGDAQTIKPLLRLGEAALKASQDDEAQKVYAHAVEVFEGRLGSATEIGDEERSRLSRAKAQARFGQAQAMWAAGDQPGQAREQAVQAREELLALGADEDVAKVRAWLAGER